MRMGRGEESKDNSIPVSVAKLCAADSPQPQHQLLNMGNSQVMPGHSQQPRSKIRLRYKHLTRVASLKLLVKTDV
ncbi:hypothetical protein HGM15179_001104 [Zosterops borbonicus]|uniref:Uncharacterized protein n=1 Tax=Zosterops borbonicus TaxID=364589 RepID=A0A8K1LU26_9PASS|nr:hypothetical protein HGM15179_001104 [Zosterops borbonicus]